MKSKQTDRGFGIILHETYSTSEETRLIQESSAIGDYSDSFENPGSSFLWVGQDHHLNREQISELIERLQYWIDNKKLKIDQDVQTSKTKN